MSLVADDPYYQQTPSLDAVFAQAARKMALELRVCMPAKVVQVLGQQRVDAKPLLMQKARNFVFEYPVVPGALVCMPLGNDYGITYRLQPGDTGLLLFADRALDGYASGDGVRPVDPNDARSHNLTDAIFVPGLVPNAKQSDETDDMVLRNGRAEIKIQKNGAFTVGNGTQELMTLVTDLAAQVQSLGVALAKAMSTAPGAPLDPDTVATATQVGVSAGQIQAGLSSLKGN